MKIKKPFDLYAWRHLFAPMHLMHHDLKIVKMNRKYKPLMMIFWLSDRE